MKFQNEKVGEESNEVREEGRLQGRVGE